jgi:hypothetical protein
MSNVIPADIDSPYEYPYCIWYPDVALENTHREVAAKHFDLRHQVGRACTVAGYTDLYLKLDRLPDMSIDEEA